MDWNPIAGPVPGIHGLHITVGFSGHGFKLAPSIAEALARRGVEFEQLIFPDEVHGFLLHRNWVAAYEAALDFLDRKLKAPIS